MERERQQNGSCRQRLGDLVVFPSWLVHKVTPHDTNHLSLQTPLLIHLSIRRFKRGVVSQGPPARRLRPKPGGLAVQPPGQPTSHLALPPSPRQHRQRRRRRRRYQRRTRLRHTPRTPPPASPVGSESLLSGGCTGAQRAARVAAGPRPRRAPLQLRQLSEAGVEVAGS